MPAVPARRLPNLKPHSVSTANRYLLTQHKPSHPRFQKRGVGEKHTGEKERSHPERAPRRSGRRDASAPSFASARAPLQARSLHRHTLRPGRRTAAAARARRPDPAVARAAHAAVLSRGLPGTGVPTGFAPIGPGTRRSSEAASRFRHRCRRAWDASSERGRSTGPTFSSHLDLEFRRLFVCG